MCRWHMWIRCSLPTMCLAWTGRLDRATLRFTSDVGCKKKVVRLQYDFYRRGLLRIVALLESNLVYAECGSRGPDTKYIFQFLNVPSRPRAVFKSPIIIEFWSDSGREYRYLIWDITHLLSFFCSMTNSDTLRKSSLIIEMMPLVYNPYKNDEWAESNNDYAEIELETINCSSEGGPT